MLPDAIPFIIFCISLNCLRSALTSCTEVPEPRATRERREPSIIVVSLRSAGVIEQTIASTLATSPSSIWFAASRMSLFMPGIRRMRPPSEPIFFTWRSWERKSSSVNCPAMRRLALFATSSVSIVRSACSIRLMTSPMPRIRSAMRSGWNRSKSARRSPVEAKAIGRPTTPLTERAAPPRASPSSLVRMTPRELECVVERLRRGDGVLSDHGVDHEERVVRLRGGGDVLDLVHHLGVDRETAGRVDDARCRGRAVAPRPRRPWRRGRGRSPPRRR